MSKEILQGDKKLRDGYKKFVSHVEMELLDYQHNNPVNIEQCINKLITLFKNIVENPEVEKFRKVKERNDILSKSVMNVRGGEQALVFSGWTRTIIDCEAFWVFSANEDSIKMRILNEALGYLQRSLQTIHAKAQRKIHEKEEHAASEKNRRERILLDIEEDRVQRSFYSQCRSPQGP